MGAWAALCVSFALVSPAVALDWPGRIESVEEAYAHQTDAESRVSALDELRNLGAGEATPLLVRALADRLPEVRAAAAEVAGELRAFEVLDVLVGRLSDRSPAVRSAAVRALGVMRARDAVGPASRLLADSVAEVRVAAVQALGEIGSAEAIVPIVDVLTDRSRDVVVAALGAMGRLGQPGTVYAVLERAHDPVEPIAIAAVDALIALRAEEARPALIALSQTGRPEVALAAIVGLGELGAAEAVPVLVSEVLSQRVDRGAGAAVAALVALDDPSGIEPLLPVLLARPTVVAPYYEAMGMRAWPALAATYERLAGPDGERSGRVLDVWLASGDARALDAAEELVAIAPPEEGGDAALLGLYTTSPTAGAFCRAARLVPRPMPVEAFEFWAGWAAGSGASECFEPLVSDLDGASTVEVLVVLRALGDAAPSITASLVDRSVDIGAIEWRDGSDLVSVLAALGPPGRDGLARMLTSEDSRLRREASFALAELPPALEDHGGDRSLLTVDVAEELRASGPYVAQLDTATAAQLLAEPFARGTPGVLIEVLELARHRCLPLDSTRLETVLRSEDYWIRRKAFEYAFACASETAAAGFTVEIPDPTVRALGAAFASPEALADVASDPGRSDVERIASLRVLASADPDTARSAATALRDDRSPIVAAAAWSVAGTEDGPAAALFVALASEHPVERAAIYAALARSHPDTPLDHARRREDDPAVRRVLDDAAPYVHGATVFLVDADTGLPRRDEAVFALFGDGSFDLRRSDREGRVSWRRDDVITVLHVASSP